MPSFLVSDHEESLDGGITWTRKTGTDPVVQVGNLAKAVGLVQVRVAADAATGRPAGNVLSNTAAFTVIAVFGDLQFNATTNVLSWRPATGTGPGSYQVELLAATAAPGVAPPAPTNLRTDDTANTATFTPVPGYANPALYVCDPNASASGTVAPPAPTNLVLDDLANTVTFTPVPGKPQKELYVFDILA